MHPRENPAAGVPAPAAPPGVSACVAAQNETGLSDDRLPPHSRQLLQLRPIALSTIMVMDQRFGESVPARATRHLRELSTPLMGVIATAFAAFAVVGAQSLVPDDWGTLGAALLGAAAGVGGFASPYLLTWLWAAVLAPFWQRNEAREALAQALDRTLTVRCEALPPRRPLGWEQEGLGPNRWPYRLTLAIHNLGVEDEFEVWVKPGIRGLAAFPDYGDFPLQWDLTEDYGRWIPQDRSRKLHVAKAVGGYLRFLGPRHEYFVFRDDQVVESEIEITLDIRSADGPNFQEQSVAISFDPDGKPSIRVL